MSIERPEQKQDVSMVNPENDQLSGENFEPKLEKEGSRLGRNLKELFDNLSKIQSRPITEQEEFAELFMPFLLFIGGGLMGAAASGSLKGAALGGLITSIIGPMAKSCNEIARRLIVLHNRKADRAKKE